MAVASGQLPYEYEWPTPFRVSNNAHQGLSGIHLEAAQFVMQSEMRKFNIADAALQAWRVYTNASIAGSGYDPKANGNTLNGLVGPKVQVDLDHISLMRDLMVDFLFGDAYDTWTEFGNNEILQDWIRQAYPNSPSGYGQTSTDEYQGQFLRPVFQDGGIEYIPGIFFGDPQLGIFTDSDPHWLGGSGIILDIDVGEVMWNPYPMTAISAQGDTHGTSDNWSIEAFPFYPSFQKTDGSLITLNGFENKWPEDRVPSYLVRNYDPVGSGKVRFNAYPILGNTQFYFGRMNDTSAEIHQIGFSTNQMSVAAISATLIGNASKNLPGSEVFLTPIALPTGVYRVACRNSKANYPFTTVESGVISQWPRHTDITSDFSAVETNYRGYEVFNNCFWITDWGFRISASLSDVGPVGPSGLSVVSPFTGKVLWQRNATNTVAGQVYVFLPPSPSTLLNVNWWDDANTSPPLSLDRVGTDDIKRLLGRSAAINPGVSFDVLVATYNDKISTVSNQTVTLSLRPNNTFDSTLSTNVEAMTFDGTSYWITGHALNDLTAISNQFVWELNSSFSEIRRVLDVSILNKTRLAGISDGNGGAIKTVAFDDDLSITEWAVVVDGSNPEGFSTTTVATKSIDITGSIPGTVQSAEIYSLREVSGITELTNGVYAFVRINTTTTNNRLYILRIKEEVSSWSIHGIWPVRPLVDDFEIPTSNMMGMIVMAVN